MYMNDMTEFNMHVKCIEEGSIVTSNQTIGH
jgi:hypothetical protein